MMSRRSTTTNSTFLRQAFLSVQGCRHFHSFGPLPWIRPSQSSSKSFRRRGILPHRIHQLQSHCSFRHVDHSRTQERRPSSIIRPWVAKSRSRQPHQRASSHRVDTAAATAARHVNPTLEWSGVARSTSEFVTHVILTDHFNHNSSDDNSGVGTVHSVAGPHAPANPPTSDDADDDRSYQYTIGAMNGTLLLDQIIDQVLQQQMKEYRRRNTQDLRSSAASPPEWSSGRELVELGSVWYLPVTASRTDGTKPRRLSATDLDTLLLLPGDYLRIHHQPRRFPSCHEFDWLRFQSAINETDHPSANGHGASPTQKPGVLVAEDCSKGWLVVNKPPNIPVHMTVDNSQENVAACIANARRRALPMAPPTLPVGEIIMKRPKKTANVHDVEPYISTPQRIDQNTSGLLVVATSRPFAAYFAKLLSQKTSLQVLSSQSTENKQTSLVSHDSTNELATETSNSEASIGGVHKQYRCLVSVMDSRRTGNNSTGSVAQAMRQLNEWVDQGTIIRHFLQPSIRAPKTFLAKVPSTGNLDTDAGTNSAWPECLLKLRRVSQPFPLIGNTAGHRLAWSLWSKYETNLDMDDDTRILAASFPPYMPVHCQAVVEVDVELLTGRTHQIRGQLSALGFPIVGDTPYGGALPADAKNHGFYSFSDRLALQCCALEFVDPVIRQNQDGTMTLLRSQRWNRFRLDSAWWSDYLRIFEKEAGELPPADATTSVDDGMVALQKTSTAQQKRAIQADLLPPRVSLSAGKNKYVLIRAVSPNEPMNTLWFVKSATSSECGGPYHGNVAQDLREWIEAAGFNVEVTGGGRIDYQPSINQAVVYGFSYAFGKGDHEKAARIIREWSHGTIDVLVDHSGDLY